MTVFPIGIATLWYILSIAYATPFSLFYRVVKP